MVFRTTRVLCLIFLLCGFVMSVSAYTVYAQNSVEQTEEDFLASAEFSAFDFFVGGNYHGLAYVFFTADWIKFDNCLLYTSPSPRDRG